MLTLKEEIAEAVMQLGRSKGWGAVIPTVSRDAETSIKTTGKATLAVKTPEGEKSILVSRAFRAEIVTL